MPRSRTIGALVDALRAGSHAAPPLTVAPSVAPDTMELCEALDGLTALWIALNSMGSEGQHLVREVERVTQLVRRAVHRGHPYNSQSVVDTFAGLMVDDAGQPRDAH